MKVSEAMEQVSMIKGNLEQVTAFLKTPELQRPADPVTLTEPTFEFSHVCFGYNKSEVLHDISFKTSPKSMTAIVGPSGSGKSTIAKLMAGFWDATSGTVLFGSQDIRLSLIHIFIVLWGLIPSEFLINFPLYIITSPPESRLTQPPPTDLNPAANNSNDGTGHY